MTILTLPMVSMVYQARLTNVIDGDTVDMYVNLGMGMHINARIRLANIDAPEIYGVKKNSEEYVKGYEARTTVLLWFEESSGLFYLNAEHKGIYGRWLGEIWRNIGEQSLNDFLIENYYQSKFWEVHSQEVLLQKWIDDDGWKRYAQYEFAPYGKRKYSQKIIGHYESSRYGTGIYKNIFFENPKGIYGRTRYGQSRYRD